MICAYLVHEPDGWALEWVLLGEVDAHLPDPALVRRPRGAEELHHELVQTSEDGDLNKGIKSGYQTVLYIIGN